MVVDNFLERMIIMTERTYQQETLDFIHENYQLALQKSSNILEIVDNLYNILKDKEVAEEDAEPFDSFIDGLRACYRFRKRTFVITNITTYITITVMYIVLYLNETNNLHLDLNWYSRRKSLESDLAKILRKSLKYYSVNIRDRFGIRGILLNNESDEEADYHIHLIFDALSGIIAAKNRKLRKDFITWFSSNDNINELDKNTIKYVLNIPFRIEFIKDYIREPRNSYQSLQFTLTVQMYSEILPGCQMEIQLRSLKMHIVAEHGEAAHWIYKRYLQVSPDGKEVSKQEETSQQEDLEKENPINKVFVVDDFSKLNIVGFTSYENKEYDQDGIHFAKEFSDRRISTTLINE